MIEQLTSRLINISTVAGISLYLLPDNAVRITLSILEKKKGIVSSIKTEENVSLEQLHLHVGRDIPVVLVVDGRGVLHRKLETATTPSGDLTLSDIIPQAKPADFYARQYKAGDSVFASLIRLQLLNELLDKIKEQKLDVVKIFLGPFAAAVVLPFIELPGEQKIVLDTDVLEVSDHTISAHYTAAASPEGITYAIGDERVAHTQLLSYAAALSFLLKTDPQTAIGTTSTVTDTLDHWEQKQVFKKMGVGVLGSFFVILLINAGLFMMFSNRNAELSENKSRSRSSLQELTQLKEDVKKNKAFVEMAGWGKKTPAWFFADRLAASLLEEIYLTDLYVHPMDEAKAKDEKKTIFRNEIVAVKGICEKPVLLNEWLGKVKKLEWVQQITKQAYQYNDKEKTGMFSFEIITKDSD